MRRLCKFANTRKAAKGFPQRPEQKSAQLIATTVQDKRFNAVGKIFPSRRSSRTAAWARLPDPASGAGWEFLTGRKEEIAPLRRKVGVTDRDPVVGCAPEPARGPSCLWERAARTVGRALRPAAGSRCWSPTGRSSAGPSPRPRAHAATSGSPLFAQAASVWCAAAADAERWRGLAVFGVDGSTPRVPDTPENETPRPRPIATRFPTGHPPSDPR